MKPLTDQEVEALRKQGYTEGMTVPGRGRLLPDGTFDTSTLTTKTVETTTPTDTTTKVASTTTSGKTLATLPAGTTALGSIDGKQTYTDNAGNRYVRNEYGIGTPGYRIDYTLTAGTGGSSIQPSGLTIPSRYSLQSDTADYEKQVADEKAALEQEKSIRRQAIIDAINTRYTYKAKGIEKMGADEEARMRSLNLRSGLIGSNVGDSAISETKKATTEALDANAAAQKEEQLAQLSALDDLYYKRKQDLTGNKLAELKSKADLRATNVAELEKRREPAKNILMALAKKGTTFDQFKLDTESYDNVKQDFDDNELQALFITNAPTTSFVSDKPEIVGNQAVWFQKQADGTVKAVKVDMGTEVATDNIKEVVKSDQGIYVINKDGSYKNIGGANIVKKTNSETLQSAFETVAPQLTSQAGSDGYVSPESYKTAKRAWINAGYNSQDFDKQFVSFVNPISVENYGFDKATFESFKKPTFIVAQQ